MYSIAFNYTFNESFSDRVPAIILGFQPAVRLSAVPDGLAGGCVCHGAGGGHLVRRGHYLHVPLQVAK